MIDDSREIRKKEYEEFCKSNYVQIYSKPWWMDVICGEDNWDVWLYKSGNVVQAAMPYYIEKRGKYIYITKAIFTQTNGIIFADEKSNKEAAIAKKQDRIIKEACEFIKNMNVDVYEQQYPYSFVNWQPFYWQRYTNFLRYTYVIENTWDSECWMGNMTPQMRNHIKKGCNSLSCDENITVEQFYNEHVKIFEKQGKNNPFSFEFWKKFYFECKKQECCKMMCARDNAGNIAAIIFLVWDEQSVYQLLGGYMPEYSSLQGFPYLIYQGIIFAGEMKLKYDFEGSMVPQLARSYREYGGTAKPYFRIRKVFNPEIIMAEAEESVKQIEEV
ncbi:MAG: GNAT family N-acetyltransferase [Lachnospiraceae bacterium]|nr:GNAT family N-acetyltransferase [Lachnospiraceae bacterium]